MQFSIFNYLFLFLFPFLICAERLSTLVRAIERDGVVQEFLICSWPMIASLVFNASTSEAREVQKILETYELASGQKVNLEKSAMVCSKIVAMEKAKELQAILGVQLVQAH